ncbi:MAG: nucleotidyltransferase family protein [Bacteroidales bacterium]|nr:nucleotidyltransferase family protein [Bacteroidales bacterium]MDD4670889.1 nucleotidyltransferase family protein [Bacteroidales bacterium]
MERPQIEDNMEIKELFFSALQTALLNRPVKLELFSHLSDEDWQKLYDVSKDHGLLAVVFNTVTQLPNELQPPHDLKLNWIVSVERIHAKFGIQIKTAHSLSEYLQNNGVQLMIMKGLSLAPYYPDPSDREFGDIDIYTFGQFDLSNRLVQDRGVEVNMENDKHSVFRINGILVENHLIFLAFYMKVGRMINDYLQKICTPDKCHNVDGLLFPDADFNVIFLLRHLSSHFSKGRSSIRNVVDWGLFLINDFDKLNLSECEHILRETGMLTAYNVFTKVAADVLGTDFSKCYIGKPDEKLAAKVLNEIYETKLRNDHYNFVGTMKHTLSVLSGNRWKYGYLLPDKFWGEITWRSIRTGVKMFIEKIKIRH